MKKNKRPKNGNTHSRKRAKDSIIKTQRFRLPVFNFSTLDTKSNSPRYFQWIYWGTSFFIFIFLIVSALNSGVNGDDRFQIPYSEKLVDYYSSFGEESFIEEMKQNGENLYLYGGFFETLAGSVNRIIGNDKNDYAYNQVRHVLVSILGFGLLLVCSLLAREVGGYHLGILALLMAFITPRLTGHSLFNPKDIPFAFGYLVSILFMVKNLKEMPILKIRSIIFLGIGIGISLGIRVGGFLLVAYWGLFLSFHYLFFSGKNKFLDFQLIKKYALSFLIPVIIGVTIGLLFWPFGLIDPIQNIQFALKEFSNFQVGIKVLFDGNMVWSNDIPIRYLITWFFITTPAIGIIGWILVAVFLKGISNKFNFGPLLIILFTFLFPIFYVLYKNSALYDGVRHFLFVVSVGTVLSSIGWGYLFLHKLKKRVSIIIGYFSFGIFSLFPVVSIISNPTLSYVFFNVFSGGVEQALGNYELDYWGLSTKQAVDWMISEGIISDTQEKSIIIASNFSLGVNSALPSHNDSVKVSYVRYRERYSKPWDYGIFVSRFMDADYIKSGTWPTSESIHNIEIFGTPIAAIYKSSSKKVSNGIKESQNRNYFVAIPILEEELKVHPDNEVVLQELANCYLNTGNLEKAKVSIDKLLQLNPSSFVSINTLGSYYLRLNDLNSAESAFSKAVKINNNNAVGYYYLALISQQKGNIQEAIRYGDKAIEASPGFKTAYEFVANLYDEIGDKVTSDKYRQAFQNIQ